MTLTGIPRSPYGRHDTSRRDPSAPWRHLDVVLVGATLVVAALGVLMVYSATRGAEPPTDVTYLVRQTVFVGIGVVAVVLLGSIDYRRIQDWMWVPYGIMVVLLMAVLTPLGDEVQGAQRWFSLGPLAMQPSEFTKLAFIVAVGGMLATWEGDIGPRRLASILVVAAVPTGLIFLQPDLGTVLELVGMLLVLLLVGGVKARYLMVLLVIGLAGATFVLTSDTLAEYQRERLTGFIDPSGDVQGNTYNQNQSVTAVASGGLMGQGLYEGPQTQLRFVPEQETDFIFTVVAEELGFLGGSLLLALYGVIVWRLWRIAQLARDLFGILLAAGVMAMFVLQIFANIGMTMGIMPVTGIPLPLVSYGGSSVLTMLLGVGLVLNVHMRRFR